MNISFDIKNDRQLQIALGATIILLIVIISIFSNNAQYTEDGQSYYLSAAIGGIMLLFWGLRSFKFIILVPSILIILISLTISTMKFDWRKGYLEKAESGKPFIFEEYIDGYPTLEEFLKAQFFGGEDWVGFARVCGEPAKEDLDVPESCQSLASIQDVYGLDMKKIVDDHYKKMKLTAKKIADGKLTDKKRFETCLQQRQCVMVPLLPANVDPDKLAGNDYSQIRRAFWSLVEDEKLNEVVCNQMELCSLLVKMKALSTASF